MSASKRLPKGWQPDRYADHVKINEHRVPEALRHLIPSAKYWSIGDDVDRAKLMARTTKVQKKALVDSVWPKLAELQAWCEANDWSDEGVIFMNLIEATAEARIELYPPPPAAQQPPNQPELPLSAEQKAELQGYLDDLKNRSRERIQEYLGLRDPILPPQISKELIEIHDRIDTLLAQCKARQSSVSPSDQQSRPPEPGAPQNVDPAEPPGISGADGGPPSVS